MNKLLVIASAFVALSVLPGCPQRANVRVDNPSAAQRAEDADRDRRERQDDRQEERR